MTAEPEPSSSRRKPSSKSNSSDVLKRSGSARKLSDTIGNNNSGMMRKERSSRSLMERSSSSVDHHDRTRSSPRKEVRSFDGHDRGRGPSSPRKESRSPRQVGDYDDAIAKVSARFAGSSGEAKSGKEKERRPSRKRGETDDDGTVSDTSHQPITRSSGHRSKKHSQDGTGHYEDALAKVAARFSAEKQESAQQQQQQLSRKGSSRKLEVSPPSKAENYEDALAKVAARFSAETSRSKSREKIPDNYEDALAKVAARFGQSGSGRSNSSRNLASSATDVAVEKPKRRGSSKSLVVAEDSDHQSVAPVEDKPRRGTSNKSVSDNAAEDKPRRRTSSKLRDDEKEIVDQVKTEVQRRLSESSHQSEGEQKFEKESGSSKARAAPERRKVQRQLSEDSVDFDGAIAEAMNEEEMNQQGGGGGTIDEPKRKVERRGSDSSLNPNKPATIGSQRGRERSRGLRRTTSEELNVMELAERAEADVRVRTDKSPKRNESRRNKTGLKVTFIEDLNEKNGIKSTYLESSEEPLTAEEKGAAWYGGRNYKLFKSMCYTESVEAKENEDYCSRFEKVWAACATTSVDFAWQEIMKAEHKKSSPNNAVMLAKARCRGFEREIFPDTLLRNRLATVKYVVRSYKQALQSMTTSKEDQETAVREASLRCSQPFRRFARLMAEGDALLVAAWERVSKKDDSLDVSRRNSAQLDRRASRRDLMAAAGRQSVRNLLSSGESRRDLFSSLKSSGSCRKLISPSDYSEESRRNLMAASKGGGGGGGPDRRNVMSKVESHRDLLMSLKSSGSSRKLMMGSDASRTNTKDHVGGPKGLARAESRRNMMSGARAESRRNMLTSGARTESKRNLITKSSSSRRLQADNGSDNKSVSKSDDQRDAEDDGAPTRPTRRGSRKSQAE